MADGFIEELCHGRAPGREYHMTDARRAFVVGGGIGGLAACAFMVRDAAVPGAAITLFEAAPVPGGSLDAGGDPAHGYRMRGSRMMITETFECTWDLLRSIPSRGDPAVSVYDETMAFSERVPWNAKARLIDRNRAVPDPHSMGFTMADRLALRRLSQAAEKSLEGSRITD
jgi:oleate hydratase